MSKLIIFSITQACSPELLHDFILIMLFVLGESPAQPGQKWRWGKQGEADGKKTTLKFHNDLTMALILIEFALTCLPTVSISVKK